MTETTSRAFGCPMRYIQGPGEIKNIQKLAADYGKKPYFLIDAFIYDDMLKRITASFEGTGYEFCSTPFGGESCQDEIDRVIAAVRAESCDMVVGIGGGKTIDTIKLVADALDVPRIIMPSAASTDAPTAGLAGLYRPDGVQIRAVKTRRNSELVLLDTEIIVNAPARLFSAGMGDAMATLFEARANVQSCTPNYIGGGYRIPCAGMAIARECYRILLADGEAALMAVKQHVVTEAVENVVEANTLLSGLGFENTGCAAAHGIHSGLSEIESAHAYLHGEKVAFSIICQMVIENTDKREMDKIIRFLMAVDLPVTLAELNIEPTEENLKLITDHTLENPLIHHEPHVITGSVVRNALLAADAIGRSYRKAGGTVI